jgi:hypothetical protein
VKLGLAAATLLILGTTFARAAEEKPSAEVLARGKLLTMIGGCQDCHTPKNMGPHGPEPDWTRELSGHPANAKLPPVDKKALTPGYWALMGPELTAYVGPWGVSYAANLTPDEQTGLGLWTEEIFIKAIRTGKHMGEGRPILPPMPWHYIKELPDTELKALFAYLRSVKPIKNAVPQPVAPPDVK